MVVITGKESNGGADWKRELMLMGCSLLLEHW
jgi:hypothetical protein